MLAVLCLPVLRRTSRFYQADGTRAARAELGSTGGLIPNVPGRGGGYMGGHGNRGGMSGLSGPCTAGSMAGQHGNGTPNTHIYQGRGAGGGRDGH
eukprot:2153747-Rhodomonas_salina.1